MVPNSELTVPVNNDKARNVLARRGDELRWFTPLGFKTMPAIYTKDDQGKSKVIPNDGWVQVEPSAFRQPPPTPTAAQVVSPQDDLKKPAGDQLVKEPVVPDATKTEPAAGTGTEPAAGDATKTEAGAVDQSPQT